MSAPRASKGWGTHGRIPVAPFEGAWNDCAEEKRAREVALQFARAYDNHDLDVVLSVSGLPWLFDATETIETQERLKEFLRGVWRRDKGGPVFTQTLKSARRYREVRPKVRKVHQLMLDEVLRPEDFVIGVQSGEASERTIFILVRLKGQAARAVGFVHE